ncbi:hypothetical protein F5B22DRAFT_234684 [Xylaria bambusicola]|uniref:uncharacterized protein n=1 Tax=Xylaria bambusicola TaxID=326684 RepID=UPI0020073226|nr:uncharacterized protein F5B22DRAFT_234684 [Xylaria bambusicola]KAI0514595.1 hypothetical protein F5B22DRAFT_234684 [Xylaria bambusicola]
MSTTILSTHPRLLTELDLKIMSVSQHSLDFCQANGSVVLGGNKSIGDDVLQALEVARDSPEAAGHGAIGDLLESTLASIWNKILADESKYIMSRDEFAIFNFFQDRFRNNPIAMTARKRYWDNLSVP